MTGTGIAQAIPIAITPILTRIYSPEDFGVFALYVGIVSVLSVVITGRYELAIVQVKEDSDAINIVTLSVLIAVLVSLLLLLVIFFFNTSIVNLIGNQAIGPWLYMVPLTVLLSGINQSLIYWLNRFRKYKKIATNRVIQSSGNAISQISMGSIKLHLYGQGLILGNLIGQLFSIFFLVNSFKSLLSSNLTTAITQKNIVKNAIMYRKLPLFSSWGALLDSAAIQLPVFVITKFYSSAITGLFSMTFKILNMPLALMSGAISQVLFAQVAKIYHEEPNKLFVYVLKVSLVLFLLSSPMVVIFNLFGRELFAFIFGQKWSESGSYAGILSFAVVVRFIVSPLSCVLALEHNIKKGVFWQVIYFCTITITLVIFSNFAIELFLKAFVIHEVILYSFYFYIILTATKKKTI